MTPPAPRIDPEELLANAAWVRALARNLVGDAALADDVAQQTVVAAIERPPRAGVPLAAWMARVARNLSFNARRAERRRALHEAAASTPAASPSPEESVARTEMFRVVVDAVLALDPLYRDVVVLRFFDDLEMTDVARRLDVPVETARTRLKRALATLRERLDAKYGDRRAWALVLVGPDAARRPWTATAATVAGGALMGKTLVAAAALVALVVGGWYVFATGDVAGPVVRRVETAATPQSAGGRAAPNRGRVAADETPPTAPAAVDAKTAGGAPSRWLVRGRLDHFDGGDGPRAKVAAYFWHQDMDFSKPPEPIRVEAAVDGRFEVDFTASIASAKGKRAVVVVVDHPAYLPSRAEVPVPEGVDADATGAAVFACAIDMRRAEILNVRVVDEDGRGAPGARVGAFAVVDGSPDDRLSDTAIADAAGEARLRLAPGGAFVVVGAAEGLARAAVRAKAGDDRATIVLRPGVAIRGRVVENGRPVAGAVLRARIARFGGRELQMADFQTYWESDGVVSATELHATTDAAGRYSITGLAEEEEFTVELLSIGADRELTGFRRQEVAPAEDVDVDFDVATSKLVVEVRSDGKPVAGVRLCGVGSKTTPKTDENGRWTVEAAPGTRIQIETFRDGFKKATVHVVAPRAGEFETVPIPLVAIRHGKFVVAVRDEDGRAIETASLAFFKDAKAAAEKPWNEIRFTLPRRASDGRASIDDLDPGTYRLVVRAGRNWNPDFTWDGDEGTWLDASTDVTVPESGNAEVVVVTRRGGRLRLAARDSDGNLVAAACTIRDAAGQVVGRATAARYGSRGACSMNCGYLDANAVTDVAEALPAGRYRVTLSYDGCAEKTVDAEIVAGKTCALDVTLDGVADPPPRWSVAPAQPK
jgi:RNA polymerase sigma-70 factor (ECF subfamily)